MKEKLILKNFYLFIILLALVSHLGLVYAVPPNSAQTFTEGYEIEYSQDNILKQGQDYTFHFNVYNISNGYPITTGVGCYFNLLDNEGVSLYSSFNNSISSVFDYSFFVSGSNFSVVDDYYYVVHCNSSTLGGYDSILLSVTPSGVSPTSADGFIVALFSLLFLIVLLIITYLFVYGLAHAISLDFDMKDLAFNYGAYFSLVGLYMLSNIYLSNIEISNFLLWVVKIGILTNVVLPTIYLILTLTIGSWMARRVKGVDF